MSEIEDGYIKFEDDSKKNSSHGIKTIGKKDKIEVIVV